MSASKNFLFREGSDQQAVKPILVLSGFWKSLQVQSLPYCCKSLLFSRPYNPVKLNCICTYVTVSVQFWPTFIALVPAFPSTCRRSKSVEYIKLNRAELYLHFRYTEIQFSSPAKLPRSADHTARKAELYLYSSVQFSSCRTSKISWRGRIVSDCLGQTAAVSL